MRIEFGTSYEWYHYTAIIGVEFILLRPGKLISRTVKLSTNQNLRTSGFCVHLDSEFMLLTIAREA
jgi:hypothetical protein